MSAKTPLNLRRRGGWKADRKLDELIFHPITSIIKTNIIATVPANKTVALLARILRNE